MTPGGKRTLALALALATSGCLFDMASEYVPLPRTCFDANLHCDVSRGEICRRADGSGSPVLPDKGQAETFDGICVLAGTQGSGEVYLELQPTDASSPRIQFGPVSLARGQNQELTMPAPVSVAGLVTYAQNETTSGVGGARVRFRSVPLIPGRSLVFETQSSVEADALGRYSQLLPVGRYLVTVQPPLQDEIKAPLERPFGSTPVEIEAATDRLDLEVTNPNALLSVTGQVLLRREGKEEPAVGLHVWAMVADPESLSARAGTGTPLAHPALTNDQGRFTLWLPGLPADAEPYKLRLEVGPSSDGEPFPTFRVDDRTLEVAAPLRLQTPVVLSHEGDDLVMSTVQGEVRGPDSLPVPLARVSLRTDESMPFAYSTTVVADEEGRYVAPVFAGRYLATATAPLTEGETPLGMCAFAGAFDVVPELASTVDLVCEERRYLYGQVIDAKARPVPDVTVAAERRPDERSAEQLHAERITDADGRFRLALTPGSYDFSFAPPAGVAALKTIRRVLVDDRQGDSLLVFALDPPFELFGQLVSDAAGQPLGGALEAWVVDANGGATLVGRGIAQRDGAYSIVLPAVGQ